MAKMSAERIKQGVRFFEKTFGKLYEIRTHHPENIQTGRAIYTANHFHHFDPIFILHAIASQRGVIAHQMAKPSLYRIPLIGKAMRRWGTIVTPRPSHGEEISFEDYERMKMEVESALDNDEALTYANAGTMTDKFGLADRSEQLTP
jgi:1-acyl-sn-glycerol-3-phosphate acyltransferase